MHDVLESANAFIIHRFVSVIDFVHGTALYRNLAAIVFVFPDVFLAQGICANIGRVFTETALDQAVHIDVRRCDIYAVPGDAPRPRLGNVGIMGSHTLRYYLFCIARKAGADNAFGFRAVYILRVPADIHNTVHIVLRNTAIDGNKLDGAAIDVDALSRRTGADCNISLPVINPDIADIICQIA